MAPIRLSPELHEHVRTAYAAMATADPFASRGVIRASVRLVDNCRSEADLDGHTVVCDEPAERGGTGRGPTPLQYFLSALAF